MKKHFPLSPPIEQIERRLFGVSEGLIEAVKRGETSPAIADTVRRSPEWTEYHNDIQDDRTAKFDEETRSPPALPDQIRDIIRRRVAAAPLASLALPAPGQIVRGDKIVTPRPAQLDAIMMAPLYVLLDAPAEAAAVWHGWLVSAETDYAGWWDFVLQEQDAPFDPEAAMVQLWNPVHLYLPMAARIVGQLSPARLQAVRSLAADFAVTEAPVNIAAWPGRAASRTTSTGLRVTTGSPLGSEHDARHRYQQLYFEAAEAVREPARLALRALAEIPAGREGSLLNRLIAAAGRAAEILLPEPPVAVPMSGDDASGLPDLSWPGLARLRLHELTAKGEGRMEVTAVGTEPLVVEVRKGAQVEERVSLLPGDTDTIAWDQGSTALMLITASGRRLELSLEPSEPPADWP
ncbi:hypothetical protein [Candidatus Accumulibacter vicinus]|uniref:Uncharacterized protein n=1 Tax=Candidatus Accumulibacter vicinus TaxID=2954382 RepID=A0A084XYT1_9PROT|nr:hypothetical protein [Candidatus Accumulibacter vicinus]KFB67625.1 MAG: hypothetical protein CAPSK01_003068 [Candidatus Accumulibacter vicinus]